MKKIAGILTLLLVVTSVAAFAAPSKVTLDVKNKPIKDVVEDMSKQAGVSIVLDPKAQGSVNASLKDVELNQVLDVVTKMTNLTWKKMQFAKTTDGKASLDQLKATALAIASLPLVGLSVEDPSTSKTTVYAKDLATSPDVSQIKLPDGYEWTTVYVVMPKVEQVAEDAKPVNNVTAVSDAQAKNMAEIAKMTTEERQQVFRNQWAVQMSLPQDQRIAIMKDQMQAMFGLDGSMQEQMREDMHSVFQQMHPQGQGGPGPWGGGHHHDNENN